MIEQYDGKSLLAAMRTLERAWEGSLTFHAFRREQWKMLRTNNPLERLTKEIRRPTKVADEWRCTRACPGLLQHEESASLLVSARLKRIHESWALRRYLDMQPLQEGESEIETQRPRPPE